MIAWGITDSWRVTEQEALHELDFIPVFPRVLLPGVDPAPSIVVVLDRIGQPELTMTYGAVKSPAPMVIAIEEARSSDAANKPYWRDTTALNWTHTEVRGLPIAYSFVSPTGRVDPSSDFWSAWQYRGVSYQLRVSWAGATPPGPETTRKEQQALAIIEGLLAAADGQ